MIAHGLKDMVYRGVLLLAFGMHTHYAKARACGT